MSIDPNTTPEPVEDAEADAVQQRRDDVIQPLVESITQREKFLLADRLGRPYSELMQDPDRVMLALAWVKLKREGDGTGRWGGNVAGAAPSFDKLLDATDAEVVELLGLDDLDDDDAAAGKGD